LPITITYPPKKMFIFTYKNNKKNSLNEKKKMQSTGSILQKSTITKGQ